MTSGDDLKQNLAHVTERIALACQRAGRDYRDVTICAVTKTHPVETMLAALDLGIQDLGENRVQDALPKLDALPPRARVHFIGRLQTNKVNKVVGRFFSIHSVDRSELLQRIDARARSLERVQRIWLQASVTGEEQKGGCPPASLPRLWAEALECSGVEPMGLMTMAAAGANETRLRSTFSALRECADGLRRRDGDTLQLSMGMSADYEAAVMEGSTHVRVGTALFGARR